ncbi:MAG: amidohydrolase [Chitinophagaceae bacterium]|nr:MAG: amidohydrolase [Chitinophagaceae bacterium]
MNRVLHLLRLLAVCSTALSALACSTSKQADLLVFNATIYTVDSAFSTAEAMVVNDGRIIATGNAADLRGRYETKETLDAGGRFIYPGFIDAHAHFMGYADGLRNADLTGTGSWDEILERLELFAKDHPDGWLLGRGWDQNDWPGKQFPDNKKLNELFPGRPILLTRVDGHAAIASQAALDLAGLRAGDRIAGGEINILEPMIGSAETGPKTLSGLLVDNAVRLVSSKMPAASREEMKKSVSIAEKNCFAMGLTTIDDCGLTVDAVNGITEMQQAGLLKMRLYVMLSDDPRSLDYMEKNGILETERLTVRGIKLYGDGALGSRGASLLAPYSDKPGYLGFLLSQPAHFDSAAARIYAKGYQMCTHAIGDSGNRTILKIYASHLKGKNDLRWRIEHAQVINPADFDLFGQNSIVPSVQPTHATSDMYWAETRLGGERVKGAYAYQQLLKQNGWLPLGTDFPVEDISPFRTFYAAVARKDGSGYPTGGYQVENALTREQAIRGMTIWAARANFEETKKGSLESGKYADFVILDKDLMKSPEASLLETTVWMTWLNGEKVFEKK